MGSRKRFSLLLIPQHRGKVIERKISLNLLVLLLVGFVILVSSGVFFSLDAASRAYDKLRLYSLERENRQLQAKLRELSATTEDIRLQMAELIEKEKKVRMVFGLPQVDEQIRELGIGGPRLSHPDDVGTNLEQALTYEAEIDRLLRQARFERDNFEQIYSTLTDRKKTLDHTPSVRPSAGYLSCGFGMRVDPFTGRKQLHRGVDLAADIGTPVYATAHGVVDQVKRDVGLGKLVRVDHEHGYTTVYAHLSRISVKRGQHLKRGEVIGAVGNTGYSTGPHLHYEVYFQGRAKNPLRYFLGEFTVD